MLRLLEAGGHFKLKVTSYGIAKPISTSIGGYEFLESQAEDDTDYVVGASDVSLSTSSHIFRHGLCRAGFAGGSLLATSRLQFDTVYKTLKPGKAVVLAKNNILLELSKPKLVAWY